MRVLSLGCYTIGVCAAAMLAGCRGGSGAPLGPAPPVTPAAGSFDQRLQPFATSRSLVAAKSRPGSVPWGIGYDAHVFLGNCGGCGNFNHDFCQTPGYHQFQSCPAWRYGERSGKYHVLKSFVDAPYWCDGVNESATSELGYVTFSQSEFVNNTTSYKNFWAANEALYQWNDYLTPTSRTLKHGTKVKFRVTLTVSPKTVIAQCDPDSNPTFDAQGPAGKDARGHYPEVVGSCEGSTFVFQLDNYSGPAGTKDVGTLIGDVGTPINIVGYVQVLTGACSADGCFGYNMGGCSEYGYYAFYKDALAAKVTDDIIPITKGVSFTTASGNKYNKR